MIWIQRSDYSSEEFDLVNPDEMIHIYRLTDWDSMAAEQKSRMETGQDFCSYGFGIVFSEGEILHLVEPNQEPFSGFYHFRIYRKILWVFQTYSDQMIEFSGVTLDAVRDIIQNWSPFDTASTISRIRNAEPNK